MVNPPHPLESQSVTTSESLLSIEWIHEASTSAGNVFAPSCGSGCGSSGCCCASTTMEDPAQ